MKLNDNTEIQLWIHSFHGARDSRKDCDSESAIKMADRFIEALRARLPEPAEPAESPLRIVTP